MTSGHATLVAAKSAPHTLPETHGGLLFVGDDASPVPTSPPSVHSPTHLVQLLGDADAGQLLCCDDVQAGEVELLLPKGGRVALQAQCLRAQPEGGAGVR